VRKSCTKGGQCSDAGEYAGYHGTMRRPAAWGSVEKPAGEETSERRFLVWVIRHLSWLSDGDVQPVYKTGVFLQRVLVFSPEKFPCGNGLVESVPHHSLTVCTIHTSPRIVISYLIDSRCLSSMPLLERAPVCLHAMSVLGGTSRGELVCHRLVPIVISPMSPYCVWY